MRRIALAAFLLFAASCSVSPHVATRPDTGPVQPVRRVVVPERPARPALRSRQEDARSRDIGVSLECTEDTGQVFNRTGVDVMPFVRPYFFDVDGDGREELIVGLKDGGVRLYRDAGKSGGQRWELEAGYFDGVQAAAFSSPAMGDIDNDGRPELLIGTGGFSSDSGKVVFFKNTGSRGKPRWVRIEPYTIYVGEDAVPALADIDGDGRLDLIVGNSVGHLFLYRNRTSRGRISFTLDRSYFRGIRAGLYAAPAAVRRGRETVIVAGNSVGRVYLVGKEQGRGRSRRLIQLPLSVSSFAAPAFTGTRDRGIDMVISDGNGSLNYFRNTSRHPLKWEAVSSYFADRLAPGPVCSPADAAIEGRRFMVVGNMYGELKLYENEAPSSAFPWKEIPGFFRGVRLPGFARGVLTTWEGRQLLIAGCQEGLRAFFNSGTFLKPLWTEDEEFFSALPEMRHAAPSLVDLGRDGGRLLAVGDAEGRIRFFGMKPGAGGSPVWYKDPQGLKDIRAGRFATPTVLADSGILYLLAGQQDGRIALFSAPLAAGDLHGLHADGYIEGIRVRDHSSPWIIAGEGSIELSVGDYDGNLRHFACKSTAAGHDGRLAGAGMRRP